MIKIRPDYLSGRIPEEIKCEQYVEDILDHHVFITPGLYSGKNGNRYIRISLCANEKTLTESLKRIELYIKKQK